MRMTALTAVVSLCLVFLTATTAQAAALEPSPNPIDHQTASIFDRIFIAQLFASDESGTQESTESESTQSSAEEEPKPEKPTKPKPVIHKVKSGDTLTAIAKQHKTSWERIFAKNPRLKHPDKLSIGDKLTIPNAKEKLNIRTVATDVQTPASAQAQVQSDSTVTQRTRPARQPRGSSAGNTYYYGYCTWYAKNMRPDLPNNLGNADTWVARAAAQGIPTGSKPRVGAIGQQGMHVVYVQKVHANGTATISEMNYAGFATISTRTVPASTFYYIY